MSQVPPPPVAPSRDTNAFDSKADQFIAEGTWLASRFNAVLEAIAARKAIYQTKAASKDGLAPDTLNEREMFEHTAEAFEYLEAEIAKIVGQAA